MIPSPFSRGTSMASASVSHCSAHVRLLYARRVQQMPHMALDRFRLRSVQNGKRDTVIEAVRYRNRRKRAGQLARFAPSSV